MGVSPLKTTKLLLMKKNITLLAVLLCITTIQAQKKIKGNGNMTTINRTTSDYDSVQFEGPFDYVLVSGKEGNIKLEGEENLLPYITTQVKNGTLVISTNKKVNVQASRNKMIKITVPYQKIATVSLAGSGDLWSEDNIFSPQLKVSVAGSGDAKLMVEATSIEANIAGSGALTLSGKTSNLKLRVTGSGAYKGADLHADDGDVSVAGSGDAVISCHGHLKARVVGSGNIKYHGNPKTEDIKVTGSGQISK